MVEQLFANHKSHREDVQLLGLRQTVQTQSQPAGTPALRVWQGATVPVPHVPVQGKATWHTAYSYGP